jgi:hypothetical protein
MRLLLNRLLITGRLLFGIEREAGWSHGLKRGHKLANLERGQLQR